jgi:glycerol-3-phosphate dehydrogenase subunit C
MTDLLNHEALRGTLDHCTICETACPVAAVSPLFPGPKYAGPQAERYRSLGEESVDLSVDYCSGCGICSQVCPQGVKIAEINAQARERVKRRDGVPLRDRIITRPTWLGRAGTPSRGAALLPMGTASQESANRT